MTANILPFEQQRPFYKVEFLGTSTNTGLPFYTLDLMLPESDGGGAVGMWSGDTLEDALDEARSCALADGIPFVIHPSARH